jgi:hypothetical protein
MKQMNPITAMLLGTFAILMLLVIMVPVALYYAWAASILWGWFIVPTFGLPPLTVLQMWGIFLTLEMLRPRFEFEKKDNSEWAHRLFALTLAPLLSLGIGYAIKNWLM